MTNLIPVAFHVAEGDAPFVDLGDGSLLQLLQADLDRDVWVVRTKFQPGYLVPTHRHTGDVYAFTLSGSWHYLEYPEMNRAGSYLFGPTGSTHTLHVPESNTEVTEVIFTIFGRNENLDPEGNVVSILDAATIHAAYVTLCEQQGFDVPHVIGIDRPII